ncbi:hypothetical protein VTK73DRAFT_881 [Phialemonium thermophilum]|uniref:Uncharacterized protein n=1 Tax=Phialemonium thermophilum TaxID=223376 RepID=A0ABR3Y376_9PEZI
MHVDLLFGCSLGVIRRYLGRMRASFSVGCSASQPCYFLSLYITYYGNMYFYVPYLHFAHFVLIFRFSLRWYDRVLFDFGVTTPAGTARGGRENEKPGILFQTEQASTLPDKQPSRAGYGLGRKSGSCALVVYHSKHNFSLPHHSACTLQGF